MLVFWGFHLVCEEAFEVLFQISLMMFWCTIQVFQCHTFLSGIAIHHPDSEDLYFVTIPWFPCSSSPVHGGLAFSVILGL
jgi:hypothetical protein